MATATIQPADHARAHETFAALLADVRDDQLDDPTPCPEWAIRDLVAHVVNGSRNVAGDGPLAPSSAADAVTAHRSAADAAQAAFAAEDGMTRTFEVPFGTVPGSVLVQIMTADALTHAWDLARATGQPTDLEPELAAALLEASRRLMSPGLRGDGTPFGPEQPAPPNATAADQLAAFLGRHAT